MLGPQRFDVEGSVLGYFTMVKYEPSGSYGISMTTERKTNPCVRQCPSRRFIELIGDKWALLVLHALSHGPRRNGQLMQEIEGISQKMLTQTIRRLESNGLVARHDFKTIPPKVEYSLTPIGESLAATLGGLRAWAERNIEAVMSNRESFDQAAGANPVGARQDPLRPRESGATD